MNRPRDMTMECEGAPMNTEDDSGILLFTQDGHSLTRCNELIGLWKTQRLTKEQTRELNEMLGNISMPVNVPMENKEEANES